MKNSIINILFTDRGIKHVAVIHSKAGTVRSNHWHQKSWHFLHVLSGRMVYEERAGDIEKRRTVRPGETVFTGPHVLHRTTFPVDTVLLSMTNNASQAEHEADLVHEKW